MVLESEDSMIKRKASSCGRIAGGAYRTHAEHMSQPSVVSISLTIKQALQDADIAASDIGYVNAHATSTLVGDIKESQAIFNTLGEKPVSSLKGHMGHTFAACGAIEAILSLKMLQSKNLIPTLNLSNPDQELAPLHYLQKNGSLDKQYILSNNFAFGGMNTALVLSL